MEDSEMNGRKHSQNLVLTKVTHFSKIFSSSLFSVSGLNDLLGIL
jgi:hypothetical protein